MTRGFAPGARHAWRKGWRGGGHLGRARHPEMICDVRAETALSAAQHGRRRNIKRADIQADLKTLSSYSVATGCVIHQSRPRWTCPENVQAYGLAALPLDDGAGQCPWIMQPRQSQETLRPLLPSRLCSMVLSWVGVEAIRSVQTG